MTRKPIVFILEKSSRNYKAPVHFHKEVIPYFKNNNIKRIVDFAAGRYLILTRILIKHFNKVIVVETKNQIKHILNELSNIIEKRNIEICNSNDFFSNKSQYNAIVLVNTLHIIPFEEERTTLLKKISEKLAFGGFLYIKTTGKSIPSIKSSDKINRYNDGYYFKYRSTKSKIYATFRTGFTLETLLSYIPETLRVEKKFIVNSKELSIMFQKFK